MDRGGFRPGQFLEFPPLTVMAHAVETAPASAPKTVAQRMPLPSRAGDVFSERFTMLMAISIFGLIGLILYELLVGSWPTIKTFGLSFLTTSSWNPVTEKFGALPFIYGTLLSSLIALIIAVPLSVATAIYLTELAPLWLRQPLTSLIEMLAAIPSVILGLWGIFVMIPFLSKFVYPGLQAALGWTPFFAGPIFGIGMLSGGIILAIMVIPIITSVSREILSSVPNLQREAAYALGATKWEVTRVAVLSYAKRGLFGAIILGLGRAIGETMAVTMVIGNSSRISASLFAPGNTMASVLANQFAEASDDAFLSALFAVGLVLFLVTVIVNLFAQLLLLAAGGSKHGKLA